MTELGKGNIYQIFVKYVSFNILSMIGLSFYILIDTYFVANGVGEKGLIGLNLALPVYSLISATGMMLGIGGATRYSIALGEGKKERGSQIFMQVLFLWLIFSFFYTVAGIFLSRQIVVILGADETILPYADSYLKVLLCCSPLLILNQILICFVRNDGMPQLSMFGMLMASASNTIMDYIFIYPLGMGMFGAAFATGMAPVFSMTVLSFHFMKKKNGFHLEKTGIKQTQIKQILSSGSSTFITEISSGVVLLTFNVVILAIMGNVGVGAYGIITNIALVCIAIFNGVSQGIQPIISFYYGAGQKEVIKKVLLCGCGLSVLLGILFYICGVFFRMPMIALFNGENNIQLAEIAQKGILIYFTAFLLSGINVVTAAFFSCIAMAKTAMCISLTRGVVALLPVVLIFSQCFGITGVWISVPVVELLTFGIVLFFLQCYFKNSRKQN